VNDVCWGELTPGDVVKWNVSTAQGSCLTLLVTNRYQGELLYSDGANHPLLGTIVEFLDLESGKVRKHECNNAVFLCDMNAFLVERGHAQDA